MDDKWLWLEQLCFNLTDPEPVDDRGIIGFKKWILMEAKLINNQKWYLYSFMNSLWWLKMNMLVKHH